MSDHEINADKIREQTEKLIELLREHHPEQEYEPEGLQLPPDPPAAPAIERKKALAPPPIPRQCSAQVPDNVREIIIDVAVRRGLAPDIVVSRQRSRGLIEARSEIYAMMRLSGMTWVQIAGMMRRDHSTVLYHARRYMAQAGIAA